MARLLLELLSDKVVNKVAEFEQSSVEKRADDLYFEQAGHAEADEIRRKIKLQRLDKMIQAGASELDCAALMTEIEALSGREFMHNAQAVQAMAASASMRQSDAIRQQSNVNRYLAIARSREFSERRQMEREAVNDNLGEQNARVNESRTASESTTRDMMTTMQPLPGSGAVKKSSLFRDRLSAIQQRGETARGEPIAIGEGRGSIPLRRIPSNAVAPFPQPISSSTRVNVVDGDLASGFGGGGSNLALQPK